MLILFEQYNTAVSTKNCNYSRLPLVHPLNVFIQKISTCVCVGTLPQLPSTPTICHRALHFALHCISLSADQLLYCIFSIPAECCVVNLCTIVACYDMCRNYPTAVLFSHNEACCLSWSSIFSPCYSYFIWFCNRAIVWRTVRTRLTRL